MKQPLVILTGPTAAGKTALAIDLARRLNGEIISADSMQVYRYMDIGSAKATEEERRGVPHHLLDVLDPREDFSVARFKELALEALDGIYRRGHLPIMAGGTGFYIQALLYDVDFTEQPEAGALRKRLEQLAEEKGDAFLHRLLRRFDPVSADKIHEHNRKRSVRAVEYYLLTGRPISEHNREARQKESPYHFLYYVLSMNRGRLYQRIDRRVDEMMEDGLVDEVRRLQALGLHRGMVSMQGLGYKEILDYLDGKTDLDEAVRVLKRDTRHFAKRQLTWFKRERDVRWLLWEDFPDKEAVLAHMEEEIRARGML